MIEFENREESSDCWRFNTETCKWVWMSTNEVVVLNYFWVQPQNVCIIM